MAMNYEALEKRDAAGELVVQLQAQLASLRKELEVATLVEISLGATPTTDVAAPAAAAAPLAEAQPQPVAAPKAKRGRPFKRGGRKPSPAVPTKDGTAPKLTANGKRIGRPPGSRNKAAPLPARRTKYKDKAQELDEEVASHFTPDELAHDELVKRAQRSAASQLAG